METQRISLFSPYSQSVKQLYEDSFPAIERISWTWMILMAFLGQADFFVYLDNQDFVGFSYSLKSKDTYYLLFLAISQELHSKGYGQRILGEVEKQAYGRSIFLVIEPLDEKSENFDLRLKRLAFYQRNGYQLLDYIYYENHEVYQVLGNQAEADIWSFERLAKRIELSGMKIRVQK